MTADRGGGEAAGRQRAAQVCELAVLDNWRAAIDALGLSEREAYELRVLVMRARNFNSAAIGAARARRRPRRVANGLR